MNIEKPAKISTKFIYACMGFGGHEPDLNSVELVSHCSRLILEVAVPRAVHQIFDLGYTAGGKELYVGREKYVLHGKSIREHLKGCQSCVLMAVTLGGQVDKLLRRTQLTDMAMAVAMDGCASSLIEDICDQINHELLGEFSEKDCILTDRFSPGYGDLPLDTQIVFSELLDMEKKIGLSQSREHLLMPRKSVTAIIGVMPKNQKRSKQGLEEKNYIEEKACDICERKSGCVFRSNGGYCGRIKD